MPIVEPNANTRVLVTGANGYIAMWVVDNLLEQGYTVRGVVRSLEKGKRLQELFSSYGDRLELFVVEDMTKESAFDEAVTDVDAIEHMASPVTLSAVDPDEYIKPALQGTLGILESALKFGNKLKRIVITSSAAAIYSTVTVPTRTFDETEWADEAIKVVRDIGKDAPPLVKYRASKTLAEKAAWEFYNKHKTIIQWDLVVLNPPLVIGPTLQKVRSPKDINVSLGYFYGMMTQDKSDEELKATYNFVDVRDVAAAHVAVLKDGKAAGERIILSNGASTWQDTRNFIYSLRPDLYTSGILPRGNLELDNTVSYKYNPEKGKKILGLKYISEEKMIIDLLEDFQARGWLAKSPDI
ncbi:D-lactaldehyde dehydrogenase [Gymnopilus junonius]|uniref:D-lactaldehyde dehydrogenase n=1 Tax=Gymnopilus junonius TaxID=109634 RepID=A0A9P5NVQ4_GYMJU|nr:D-lactaldehyde dehydrogenase [Gymnopilus junonius]KAF8907945.1 D-lactaldehyde dehydrogenase [Gymnopilus junonius]